MVMEYVPTPGLSKRQKVAMLGGLLLVPGLVLVALAILDRSFVLTQLSRNIVAYPLAATLLVGTVLLLIADKTPEDRDPFHPDRDG